MKTWFAHLKIRTKILVAVGAVLVGTTAMGVFAVERMGTANRQSTAIVRDWVPGIELIGAVKAAAANLRVLQYTHLVADDEEHIRDAETQIRQAVTELAERNDGYAGTMILASDSVLYDEYQRQLADYQASWDDVQILSRAMKKVEASDLMGSTVAAKYAAMNATLDKLVQLNHDEADKANALGEATFQRARIAIAVAILLCLAFGVVISIITGRVLSAAIERIAERATSLEHHCIADMRDALDGLSRGNLTMEVAAVTTPIGSTDRDEIGEVSRTVDRMIASVQDMIRRYAVARDTLNNVIGETSALTAAAQAGKLDTRADADRYEGGFHALVSGMNGTMNAVAVPLGEAQTVLARVADRDLRSRMTGTYAGDFDVMKRAINTAIDNIETALAQVATAAEQVAAASGQITDGSQSLASGASEQAASLEEVASSTTEFASVAQSTASNAREAKALAETARGHAQEGSTRMARLTDAVADIREGSVQTAKIVKTIEEIAFQTNLLALNAAVEAARAGDAGRGFAVVADEVRALALRSAEAAKSTATLIEKSMHDVARGVSLNGEVLQSLNEINAQVGRVADVIADISEAAGGQAQGVTQINAAVDQLNGATQLVASNAEESASAAEELSSQARTLEDTVRTFHLSESALPGAHRTGGSRRHAPSAPRARAKARTPVPAVSFAAAGSSSVSSSASSSPSASRATDLIPFGDDDVSIFDGF